MRKFLPIHRPEQAGDEKYFEVALGYDKAKNNQDGIRQILIIQGIV